MTQDEISPQDVIEMARQAGLHLVGTEHNLAYTEVIEDFAKLVAAKEREACAKLCDERARVLDAWFEERKQHMSGYGIAFNGGVSSASKRCASSIRARGG